MNARERNQTLRLIQLLGRHWSVMPDTWLRLAVGLAIAALYSEWAGNEHWIFEGAELSAEAQSQ